MLASSKKVMEESLEIDDNCHTILGGMAEIQQNLTEQLQKATQKIVRLEGDLQSAHEMLDIDPLTMAFNRHKLSLDIPALLQHPAPEEKTLFLFILDLDDFKQINDTYGHILGDKVLIYLVGQLKKFEECAEGIYRYGGEEFVFAAYFDNTESARFLGEKIREKV